MYSKNAYCFIYDDKGFVNVWVDGACFRNGQPGAQAGLGVFYNWNHRMNVSEPVDGRATNNVGELQAAIRAIEDCNNKGVYRLRINTDSKFLIDSCTKWLERWEQNDFCKSNGDPLANKDEFRKLSDQLNNYDMIIRFRYVPAHSGNSYNDKADRLAKKGAEEYECHDSDDSDDSDYY